MPVGTDSRLSCPASIGVVVGTTVSAAYLPAKYVPGCMVSDTPPTPEMQTMDVASQMAMGTQLARTAAETELIKAQTGKVKEETKKTGTEIESLTQGIENQKAQEALTATQTALTDLELS